MSRPRYTPISDCETIPGVLEAARAQIDDQLRVGALDTSALVLIELFAGMALRRIAEIRSEIQPR